RTSRVVWVRLLPSTSHWWMFALTLWGARLIAGLQQRINTKNATYNSISERAKACTPISVLSRLFLASIRLRITINANGINATPVPVKRSQRLLNMNQPRTVVYSSMLLETITGNVLSTGVHQTERTVHIR